MVNTPILNEDEERESRVTGAQAVTFICTVLYTLIISVLVALFVCIAYSYTHPDREFAMVLVAFVAGILVTATAIFRAVNAGHRVRKYWDKP